MNRRPAVCAIFLLSLLLAALPGKEVCAQAPASETATPAPAALTAAEAAAQAGITYPTRIFAGFGDVVYGTAPSPGTTGRQFSLGQLTLQGTSALSPKTFLFAEGTFTPRADAGQGSPAATGYNAEVERLFLRYDQNDQFKISAGRYHTPINWWNTAFHHGLWLQTTIARPEMTRFGGQFIPNHFVGLLFEGSLPSGGLNLNYNAGVGNGRASVTSRASDAGDSNDVPAELLNLFVRPDKLYGIQMGGSVYLDTVPVTYTTNGTSSSHGVRETILAAHVVYQKENPEVIAEYAHIHHDGGIGGSDSDNTHDNEAYYIQVAYRRPGGLFKPYYRYEKVNVATGDPVLTTTPGLTGHTAGVRYDFTEFAALKLEYRDMKRTPSNVSYGVSTRGGFAQISFAF